MLWILLGGVVLGLLCLAAARTHRPDSARGLGKGGGHANSARYRNRSRRHREKKKISDSP